MEQIMLTRGSRLTFGWLRIKLVTVPLSIQGDTKQGTREVSEMCSRQTPRKGRMLGWESWPHVRHSRHSRVAYFDALTLKCRNILMATFLFSNVPSHISANAPGGIFEYDDESPTGGPTTLYWEITMSLDTSMQVPYRRRVTNFSVIDGLHRWDDVKLAKQVTYFVIRRKERCESIYKRGLILGDKRKPFHHTDNIHSKGCAICLNSIAQRWHLTNLWLKKSSIIRRNFPCTSIGSLNFLSIE